MSAAVCRASSGCCATLPTASGSRRSCAARPRSSPRRPGEGRVPGDAGPRAAQPAGPDPQRAADPARRGGDGAGHAMGQAHDASSGRSSTWPGWSTTCSTSPASPGARSSSARSRSSCRPVVEQRRGEPARPLIETRGPRADGHAAARADPAARGRPDPARAGAREPAQQRRQVHAIRAADICARRPTARATRCVIRVRDNGIGIPRRDAAAHLRPVRPGRPLARPRPGRAGHRPDAGAQAGRAARRAPSSVHSDGPGRGSEFVVRLPLA